MKSPHINATRPDNKPHASGHPQALSHAKQNHAASVQAMPGGRRQYEFAIAEHIQVQREIEARAHRNWCASGWALENALNDWLKAEAEVLAEFVKARLQTHPVSRAPKVTRDNTGGARPLLPILHLPPTAMSQLESAAASPQLL